MTTKRLPRGTVLGWAGLLAAAAVVVVAGIYVVFWPVSDLIARHDVGAITGPGRAAALQAARDAARGRLLTFGAGLFAAGALVYVARHFTLSRRSIELAEQGRVTDRYTKAISQLGSGKLDVRIGGIYALERITGDSAKDHPTVMEVLAAFVREHSCEQGSPAADVSGAYAPRRGIRPDIQAAVTVIGRRDTRRDRRPVNLADATLREVDLGFADLTNADLSRVIFAGADLTFAKLTRALLTAADLTGADLTGADLTFANLTGAYLTRADLTRADLTRTDLRNADLSDADLSDADLTGAYLSGAVLTGAYLTQADLTGTDLTGTDLTGATLSGAYLTRADLSGADLTNTLWLPDGIVPEGWERDTDSGRLKRADTHPGDAETG